MDIYDRKYFLFFFQAEDGIRDADVTGVQTCALPIWDDHPVLRALARSNRVEQASDNAVEPMLLVSGEREELVHRLGVGIRPPTGRRGTVDAASVLSQQLRLGMIAVDLG